MQKILMLMLAMVVHSTFAQTNPGGKTDRKGLVFGLGLGAGVLSLNAHDTTTVSFSTTLPNIKVGYWVGKKLALLVLLPGANYKYNGKDRGFEAFTVAGQYWAKERWWVLGGMGLTFDAPAFYTVKDPATADFYTGFPALTFATGYEVWRKGRFAIDLQYRLFIGQSNLEDNSHRTGVSNMFIVGVNWY